MEVSAADIEATTVAATNTTTSTTDNPAQAVTEASLPLAHSEPNVEDGAANVEATGN